MEQCYKVNSAALEASHLLRDRPGIMVGLLIRNTGPDQEILLFDAVALPAEGVAPTIAPLRVSSGTTTSLDMPETGIPFSYGCVVCNSSTAATKTIGATDCWFTAVFKSDAP